MGNSAHKPSDSENFSDEVELPSTENDYPAPYRPVPLKDLFEKSSHWFTDENNASNDVELMKYLEVITSDVNTMSDEVVDDNVTSRAVTNNHLKLAPSFIAIDRHARMADQKLLDSFENLFEYLKEPLLLDHHKNTRIARAILVWLSQQNLEARSYGKKSTESPRGLMQYLKERKMSYITCYAILCRKAGLQCAIVNGYTQKAADSSLSSWNVVFVESGWQIVHAYWACRAVFGYNSGKWTKVEQDGQTMSKKKRASAGTEQNVFNEVYFMPDPEQFIYQCCAQKKEWQLVPSNSVVSSFQEFAKKPNLFFPFFELGLQLTSEQNCVLESKNGTCKIELKAKSSNAHLIHLSYELFRKEPSVDPHEKLTSETENKDDDKEDIARMVFNSRSGEFFTFDIRFPKTGIYKLVIRGGPYNGGYRSLCEFKLICKQEMVGNNLLPIDSGKIGWGPGPTLKEAGLLLPSKPSGLVPVNGTNKKTDVKFQLRDNKESYTAVVHGEVSGRRQKVENSVQVEKLDHTKQLVVTVSLPEKGEYGLSIQHMVKKDQTHDDWENVCHYLLSTLIYKHDKANVKLAKERLKNATEKDVEARSWKEQIKEIKICIAKCQKESVPESADEMVSAHTKLVFLTCRDKLRDCVLRRNIHVLQKTLPIVSLYKDKEALSEDVARVKKILSEIIALGGYARMVPKLEEAQKEVIALKHAPDEVYNTFKALFVLLGEPTCNYMDWTSIQTRMRASHQRYVNESILYKMRQIQEQQISTDLLEKTSQILHIYDEYQVRNVNTDAHSFYVWIENVINVHKGK